MEQFVSAELDYNARHSAGLPELKHSVSIPIRARFDYWKMEQFLSAELDNNAKHSAGLSYLKHSVSVLERTLIYLPMGLPFVGRTIGGVLIGSVTPPAVTS